jgi:hypothetical protein
MKSVNGRARARRSLEAGPQGQRFLNGLLEAFPVVAW